MTKKWLKNAQFIPSRGWASHSHSVSPHSLRTAGHWNTQTHTNMNWHKCMIICWFWISHGSGILAQVNTQRMFSAPYPWLKSICFERKVSEFNFVGLDPIIQAKCHCTQFNTCATYVFCSFSAFLLQALHLSAITIPILNKKESIFSRYKCTVDPEWLCNHSCSNSLNDSGRTSVS